MIVVRASATPILALGAIFAAVAGIVEAALLFQHKALAFQVMMIVLFGGMFAIVAIAMGSSSLVLDSNMLRQRGLLGRAEVDLREVTGVRVGMVAGDLTVLTLKRGEQSAVDIALGPFAKNAIPLIEELRRRFPDQ